MKQSTVSKKTLGKTVKVKKVLNISQIFNWPQEIYCVQWEYKKLREKVNSFMTKVPFI